MTKEQEEKVLNALFWEMFKRLDMLKFQLQE